MTVESFSGTPGPAVPLSHEPVKLFSLFFDEQVIDLIVKETNRYASQCRGDNTWQTTADEIRAYFGFHVLMGINRLPEIRDYWSRDHRLHYSAISERISRDRFEEISRYLHFADNTALPARGEPGYYRLQKVEPIIGAIRDHCLRVHKPRTQNSVDEAMIPFKGKHTHRTLMHIHVPS